MTDRAALIRQRARSNGCTQADFLHQTAIDEVHDRVSMVNKSFTQMTIVTGHPEIWQAAFCGARVVTDDDTLALEAVSCDFLVHAMALHWANDPVGQLIQCRQALRPDGMFLAISPGGQSLHELRACLGEAEIARTGGLSPRVVPMGEVRTMGGLLGRAGFAMPVADSFTLRAVYADAYALMRDLRAMGESNALAGRRRQFTPRSLLHETAQRYAQTFTAPEGGIEARYDLITLSGWAPDSTQPQPLRPGSAQMRLADALAAVETKL